MGYFNRENYNRMNGVKNKEKIRCYDIEEPDYSYIAKEVPTDPSVLASFINDNIIHKQDDCEHNDVKNEKLFNKQLDESILKDKIWRNIIKMYKNTPTKFMIFYMKFYMGLTERDIASYIGITQPGIRRILIGVINDIKVQFKKEKIEKYVEFDNMVRKRK